MSNFMTEKYKTKMKKSICIEKCSECPFFFCDLYTGACVHPSWADPDGKMISRDIVEFGLDKEFSIPDWCPLKDFAE
jgi:hypothetical protein